MQYPILFPESPEHQGERFDEAKAPACWAGWMGYIGTMNATGRVTGGAGLEAPDAATYVRVKDRRRLIQDGPCADAKERLGGFMIMQADLDTVLEWAADRHAPALSLMADAAADEGPARRA